MDDQERIERLMAIADSIGRGAVPVREDDSLYTAGAFDLIVFKEGNRAKVFALLADLCAQYDSLEKNGTDLGGYVYILEQAARSTGTTEMPPGMERIMRDNPRRTGGLREWYRMDAKAS
jgi:hypothetical protein